MHLAFICDNEAESAALMEFMRSRSAGAGAPPAGPPMGAPPAAGPPPGAAPAGPPPMAGPPPGAAPPPPPTQGAAGPITVAHVMAVMQTYRQKAGDAGANYINQLFQQAGIQQLGAATQPQLDWLYQIISKL